MACNKPLYAMADTNVRIRIFGADVSELQLDIVCYMEGREAVTVLPVHGDIYVPVYRWPILGRAGYAG